jgi:aspartate racemase
LSFFINLTDHNFKSTNVKTIGLFGGTGWVSTLEYYRYLNQGMNERLGGLSSARIFLHSVNFAELNELKKQGPQEVYAYIKTNLLKLVDAGADFVMLGANTLHLHAEELVPELPVPLLHIADATAEAITAKGFQKVGLLGTMLTMEKDFYKKRLSKHGIEVVVPEKEDREFIDHVIWHELEKEIFSDTSKSRFLEIMAQLAEKGAEGMILGCTEIPLLIHQEDTRLELFDTLKIHAEAAVEFALKD